MQSRAVPGVDKSTSGTFANHLNRSTTLCGAASPKNCSMFCADSRATFALRGKRSASYAASAASTSSGAAARDFASSAPSYSARVGALSRERGYQIGVTGHQLNFFGVFAAESRFLNWWSGNRENPLGKKLALEAVAGIVIPDTAMQWHRESVARQFDISKDRKAAAVAGGLPGKTSEVC
jgi:hypothetical protein